MNSDFPRILALLRKENNISQKQAAKDLQISQALLSHYEKGIRECGLDFVVKTANYYNVSCDYLLGRSPDRSGATITVDDIPEPNAAGKENVFNGSILPVLNKKLITNSLNIVFDLLSKSKNKNLITEISSFLMLSVYRAFRIIFSGNRQNQESFFTVSKSLANAKATAKMAVNEANAASIINGENSSDNGEIEADSLSVSGESLNREYPMFSSSLVNLIQNCENNIKNI